MERISTKKKKKKKKIKKEKENHLLNSVFKGLRSPSYYFNVSKPLIISLIFIFLSCREKDHNNKEFSCENSKLHRES